MALICLDRSWCRCTTRVNLRPSAIYSAVFDPNTLGSRIENDLDRIADSIEMNGLKMNISKTKLLVLNRRGKRKVSNPVHIQLKDSELRTKDSVKYLEVQIDRIDSDLTWKTHIEKTIQQCKAKLSAIR